MAGKAVHRVEWQTLSLIILVYLGFLGATAWLAAASLWVAVPVTGVLIALYSSLEHEVTHGHPTDSEWINAAVIFPSLNPMVPYLRFRDTHLAHHMDSRLTDPYDDPESAFLDQGDWVRLPSWVRSLLNLNNTLAGRLVLGPLIGQAMFMAADWKLISAGDRRVLIGWLLHIPAAAPVLWWVWQSPMPVWAYLVATYIGLAILKVRTFAEHQAHELTRGRSVIIEDRGPLAFLFLNNNLHIVHHMHPKLPWYALPARYRAGRKRYLDLNGGYRFRSYGELFRRHLFRAKDPVPHPLWQRSP